VFLQVFASGHGVFCLWHNGNVRKLAAISAWQGSIWLCCSNFSLAGFYLALLPRFQPGRVLFGFGLVQASL